MIKSIDLVMNVSKLGASNSAIFHNDRNDETTTMRRKLTVYAMALLLFSCRVKCIHFMLNELRLFKTKIKQPFGLQYVNSTSSLCLTLYFKLFLAFSCSPTLPFKLAWFLYLLLPLFLLLAHPLVSSCICFSPWRPDLHRRASI